MRPQPKTPQLNKQPKRPPRKRQLKDLCKEGNNKNLMEK
jgi:hypothetical protein